MIVIPGKYKLLNVIESIFRLYLPIAIIPVAIKVLSQLPFKESPIVYSSVTGIYVFLALCYLSHNAIQGYKLLTTQAYQKIKIASFIATIIGLIYTYDRIKHFIGEFELNGISKYSIYFCIFSILLIRNIFKDVSILLSKTNNKHAQ